MRVENDANCFALSEASDGAGAGLRTVFGVILGTGCGGGIVVDGGCVAGRHRIAGEWGHNPLPWPTLEEMPGPHCWCGQWGCLETLVSAGPALARDCDGPRRARRERHPGARRRRRPRGRRRRWTATPTGWRAGWRWSSTCSTPTSSCSAAACPTWRICTTSCRRLMRRDVFSDVVTTPILRNRARRFLRRARRRLAVAADRRMHCGAAAATAAAACVRRRSRGVLPACGGARLVRHAGAVRAQPSPMSTATPSTPASRSATGRNWRRSR